MANNLNTNLDLLNHHGYDPDVKGHFDQQYGLGMADGVLKLTQTAPQQTTPDVSGGGWSISPQDFETGKRGAEADPFRMSPEGKAYKYSNRTGKVEDSPWVKKWFHGDSLRKFSGENKDFHYGTEADEAARKDYLKRKLYDAPDGAYGIPGKVGVGQIMPGALEDAFFGNAKDMAGARQHLLDFYGPEITNEIIKNIQDPNHNIDDLLDQLWGNSPEMAPPSSPYDLTGKLKDTIKSIRERLKGEGVPQS